MKIFGFDVGGVNTKASFVRYSKGEILEFESFSKYFEIWKGKERLKELVLEIKDEKNPDFIGVTMTAELSDVFRTKREGVYFVLDCFEEIFKVPVYVISNDGNFLDINEARKNPLKVAAANWIATALFLSKKFKNFILIDVGTTTTDIIPVLDGNIFVKGRTDLERLQWGELVFTGALRTPISSITKKIPVKGLMTRVSPEYFAISGDVYTVLDFITEKEYVCNTPDGRGKSKKFCMERLARVVCGDMEMLTEKEVVFMARYIQEKQVEQICDGLWQVVSRVGFLPVILTGFGKFLAEEASKKIGLKKTIDLEKIFGKKALITTPSLAVAYLVGEMLEAKNP